MSHCILQSYIPVYIIQIMSQNCWRFASLGKCQRVQVYRTWRRRNGLQWHRVATPSVWWATMPFASIRAIPVAWLSCKWRPHWLIFGAISTSDWWKLVDYEPSHLKPVALKAHPSALCIASCHGASVNVWTELFPTPFCKFWHHGSK